jgi:hypothetical protein
MPPIKDSPNVDENLKNVCEHCPLGTKLGPDGRFSRNGNFVELGITRAYFHGNQRRWWFEFPDGTKISGHSKLKDMLGMTVRVSDVLYFKNGRGEIKNIGEYLLVPE